MRDTGGGAYGVVGRERLLITRTQLLQADRPSNATPGHVVRRNGEAIVVQCGDGQLELVSWRVPENDPEAIVSA
jgi:methionyl-tRNA formyltransferase